MKNMKKIVAANWKMNPQTPEEARALFNKVRRAAAELKQTKVVILPPFVYLNFLKPDRKKIFTGAQNAFWLESGAFTGEVSPQMIKNSGADFAVVGHSERRKAGETDEIIARKVMSAVQAGLSVILCVGEEKRDADGAHLGFLKEQIKNSLGKIERKHLDKIIIAYEPVWAISSNGNGGAMAPLEICEAIIFIKKVLSDIYGNEWISRIPILYGGSVGADNAGDVVARGEADGLLVGRASLNAEEFGQILKEVDGVKR